MTIHELSDAQWLEIKKLALDMYESGLMGGDRTKCTCAAFVEWLSCQKDAFILEVDEDSIVH